MECSGCHAKFEESTTTMYPRLFIPKEELVARRLSDKKAPGVHATEMLCADCFDKDAKAIPKRILIEAVKRLMQYNLALNVAIDMCRRENIATKEVTTNPENIKIWTSDRTYTGSETF